MNIAKYTLAMSVSEKSLLNEDDLQKIADSFKINDNVDIVICQSDVCACRYRGLTPGIVQLAGYILDDIDIIPSLSAIVNNSERKGLGKGFILVNRSTLSKCNENMTKDELIKDIIDDISNSIVWIEKI